METKANYLLIGVFSLLGFLGILGFILWFANLELHRQFAYYDVYFPDVSGLSVSSDVRFAGLSVGNVVEMGIAEQGDGAVRVRLELREGVPVRTDSTAALAPQGVTGTVAVAITSGSPNAPLLRDTADGGVPVIPSSRSMLQTLSDEGPQIIERLSEAAEQLTNLLSPENQKRVSNILENVENSTGNLDKAIADVTAATGSIAKVAEEISGFGTQISGLSDAAKVTLSNADAALKSVTEATDKAQGVLASGQKTFDEVQDFVASDLRDLSRQVTETTARIETSLTGMDKTVTAAGRAFESADKVLSTEVGPVATDLRATLARMDETMGKLVGDLPKISEDFRNAAQSASRAFESMDTTMTALKAPAMAFAREGLPQFTRVAVEMRSLIDNINGMVTALRRNPPPLLSGQRTPEFRR